MFATLRLLGAVKKYISNQDQIFNLILTMCRKKINLKSKIRKFTIPRNEHPVISAKMPKLPPKLANLSKVLYLASITLISGFRILQWTIIRSWDIPACFPMNWLYPSLLMAL